MSRSRKWCWTLNNPSSGEEQAVKAIDCRYMIYGKEVGEETSTPHLQGFILFKNKKSLKQLKRLIPRAHLEIAKGSIEQNIDYCSKDGEVFTTGVPPRVQRAQDKTARNLERNRLILDNDLNELADQGLISVHSMPVLKKAKMIYRMALTPLQTDNVRGIWVYGPPGTGKTHWVDENFGDSLYKKAQNKWFDGYTQEKYITIDDLDSNVLGHYLKIWADKWACSGEIKGGTVHLRHEKFIVTSNYTIAELWPDDLMMQKAIERRFEVKEFLVKNK